MGPRRGPVVRTPMARFARAPRRTGRITARTGGSSRAMPRTSLRNPGVMRRAPARMIRAPSASSRPGTRPAFTAPEMRRRTPTPSRLTSQPPTTLTTMSSATVSSAPMVEPTWMMTASSTMGTTRNTTASSHATGRSYREGPTGGPGRLAEQLPALDLVEAAPDAVGLPDLQRVGEAGLAHRAGGADGLGPGLAFCLLVLALEVRRREEHRGLRAPARSSELPVVASYRAQ